MRGSTNRSSCEATMTSPSALASMSFIVIHRILMNEKKQRKRPLWWVKRLFKNGLQYGISWRYCRAYVATIYKTGIGLTTGFIGSHTVTHNYSVYTLTAHYSSLQHLPSLLTITTDSHNWVTTPAEFLRAQDLLQTQLDLTGSHWPSTNSSAELSPETVALTLN
jgi:hypothetical protein